MTLLPHYQHKGKASDRELVVLTVLRLEVASDTLLLSEKFGHGGPNSTVSTYWLVRI